MDEFFYEMYLKGRSLLYKFSDWNKEIRAVTQFPALVSIFGYLRNRGLELVETEGTILDYKRDLQVIDYRFKENEIDKALNVIFGIHGRTLLVADISKFITTSTIPPNNQDLYKELLSMWKYSKFTYYRLRFIYESWDNRKIVFVINEQEKYLQQTIGF